MTQMCWSSNTEVLYNTSVTGASTSLAVNELVQETSTLFERLVIQSDLH